MAWIWCKRRAYISYRFSCRAWKSGRERQRVRMNYEDGKEKEEEMSREEQRNTVKWNENSEKESRLRRYAQNRPLNYLCTRFVIVMRIFIAAHFFLLVSIIFLRVCLRGNRREKNLTAVFFDCVCLVYVRIYLCKSFGFLLLAIIFFCNGMLKKTSITSARMLDAVFDEYGINSSNLPPVDNNWDTFFLQFSILIDPILDSKSPTKTVLLTIFINFIQLLLSGVNIKLPSFSAWVKVHIKLKSISYNQFVKR